jgi:hypothetical protein
LLLFRSLVVELAFEVEQFSCFFLFGIEIYISGFFFFFWSKISVPGFPWLGIYEDGRGLGAG